MTSRVILILFRGRRLLANILSILGMLAIIARHNANLDPDQRLALLLRISSGIILTSETLIIK
ncbi:hypothetical protein WMY93_033626, partial [Mugilogobius chulae]